MVLAKQVKKTRGVGEGEGHTARGTQTEQMTGESHAGATGAQGYRFILSTSGFGFLLGEGCELGTSGR